MNQNLSAYIAFFICLLGPMTSCVDSIDFAATSTDRFVVIMGNITTEAEPYIVSVRWSGTHTEPEMAISGAEVHIWRSDGDKVLLAETAAGVYESDPASLLGKVGEKYKVQVVLPDGSTYESAIEEMLPQKPMGDLSFEFVREEVLNELSNIVLEKKIKVNIENKLPIGSEPLYYKWETAGEYEFRETAALSDIFATTGAGPLRFTCFLDDKLDFGDIHVFDGEGLGKGQTFVQEIKKIPVNYKFAFNYCVHVRQLSITREAYEFWDQVHKTSNRNGIFVSAAPGQVRGNISKLNDASARVLGYFYTSAVSSGRMFIQPEAVASPLSPCFNIDPVFAGACEECLELAGSRRGAPDYWPE